MRMTSRISKSLAVVLCGLFTSGCTRGPANGRGATGLDGSPGRLGSTGTVAAPGTRRQAPATSRDMRLSRPIDAAFQPAGSRDPSRDRNDSRYDPWTSAGEPLGSTGWGSRRELVDKALQIAGQPVTEENRNAVNLIVTKESGWNPNAQNNTDSNAAKGQPSQGLMQTIPDTFRRHANPDCQEIKDPLCNLIAGIRYSVNRYGSLSNVPGVRAVSQGRGYVGY